MQVNSFSCKGALWGRALWSRKLWGKAIWNRTSWSKTFWNRALRIGTLWSGVFVMLAVTQLAGGAALADKAPALNLERLDGGYCRVPDEAGGSVILIEFWGTCCRAKLAQLKYLDELKDTYGDRGLVVYGINVDNASAKSRIKPAVRKYGYRFPVLLDPDHEALKNFSPSGTIPYTVLIDGKGEIIFSAPGNKTVDRSSVEKILSELFEAGQAAWIDKQ